MVLTQEQQGLTAADGPVEAKVETPAEPPVAEQPPAPEAAANDADLEDHFFSSHESHAPVHVETFDDLDEGHPRPASFWNRIFTRKRGGAAAATATRPIKQPARKKK